MADSEDQHSKTEEPSQRKLDKLRDEGQIPTSREVNHVFALIGMLLIVGLAGPWSISQLVEMTANILQNAGTTVIEDSADVGAILSHTLLWGLIILMPLLIIMMVTGIAGGVIQSGGNVSSAPLTPRFDKISPAAGFKRMFSIKAVVELLKSSLKFGVVGGGMGAVVWAYWSNILIMADSTLMAGVNVTYHLMLWILAVALFIMVLLAMTDYLFQYFQFIKQNRMSREDMKQEFKESEGDPHVKQRIRQIRTERARKRMMSAVPNADVVITNPTHYAVALRYQTEEGDAAPRVLAKGADHLALRIREVAQQHDIPLYEDPPLARALYAQVEVDEEIPIQLYEVVAKVIAFVMDMKRKK